MSAPSLPPFFENEIDNEYWFRELQALRDVNLMDNAEQDTLPYEAQQTEQAVQDPQDSLDESPEDESAEDESAEDESAEDESVEDETLWGQSGSRLFPPPPSTPHSQFTLALPVPAPPVATEPVIPEEDNTLPLPLPLPQESKSNEQDAALLQALLEDLQNTVPPASSDADVAADNALDGAIPELPKAQPKQPRAAAKRAPKQNTPKRIPNRVNKQPKRLSPNEQQRQWDREGTARLTRLRNEKALKAAVKAASEAVANAAAAQLVNRAPGQLYGPNQFGNTWGYNLPQATSVYCPPAASPVYQQPAGGYLSQAAGPVYQQPPMPPVPTAAFGAYVPSPALPLPLAPSLALAPHLAPPPSLSYPQIPTTSMDPGIMLVGQGSEAATWQPLPTPEQQAMYQDPMWFNLL